MSRVDRQRTIREETLIWLTSHLQPEELIDIALSLEPLPPK